MVTRGSYPLQHPDHLHCQVHEVHECFQKSRLGFKKFSSQGIGVRVRVTLPKQMKFRKIHPTHPRPPFGTFPSPVPKEFMKYIHVYKNKTKYHCNYKPRCPDAPTPLFTLENDDDQTFYKCNLGLILQRATNVSAWSGIGGSLKCSRGLKWR